RTGDLAVVFDGQLYITGRIKDLVVVAGRNHYPQDIEATAVAAANQETNHLLPGVVAAFAVGATDSGSEGLVIIAERDPEADPAGDEAAVSAIRAAVSSTHGVQPDDVRIVDVNAIPRSSANKIARRVAAKLYLNGSFN
ncbi:MAG TPA: acyl-CoA synthase, partial [Candidatus Corynebacterium avicola]|nr:acyl-CoA synthase [Candidatus Corynebacterium avicola]